MDLFGDVGLIMLYQPHRFLGDNRLIHILPGSAGRGGRALSCQGP